MSKERPILFNGAMVRAILSGAKTQTRRLVKPQPLEESFLDAPGRYQPTFDEGGQLRVVTSNGLHLLTCPFGQPGDRLWVRETTVDVERHGYIGPVYLQSEEGIATLQGGLAPAPDDMTEVEPHEITLRPSIHMTRSMCRLVLEITDVRVERLQAISEADAIAEGLTQTEIGGWLPGPCDHPEWAFHQLWNQVYGESAWDSNPWVWVIHFKRLEVSGV